MASNNGFEMFLGRNIDGSSYVGFDLKNLRPVPIVNNNNLERIYNELCKDCDDPYLIGFLKKLRPVPNVYDNLEEVCDVLCDNVKNNNKVLLSKTPQDHINLPESIFLNEELVKLPWADFKTLSRKEIYCLEKRYNSRKDMKGFDNPFNYQPLNSDELRGEHHPSF